MTELKDAPQGTGNSSVDPSADFEPTRPGVKWILIGLAFVIAAFSIANWPRLSSAAHIQEIEHALGIN